jgi:hypothetical protein
MTMGTRLLLPVVLLLLLVSALIACAPQAKPAAPQAPAQESKPVTPAPVTTPPAEAPAVTPPPAPVVTEVMPPKVSFPSKTYTNDEYKFMVLYPDSWKTGELQKYHVFKAANTNNVGVYIAIYDTANQWDQSVEQIATVGGSNLKEVSSADITLADGKTKGKIGVYTFSIAIYKLKSLSLNVERGLKTVSVAYSAPESLFNESQAKEIVTTLTFK